MSLGDLVFKNDGPWGTGKGSALTSMEGDENVFNLREAVQGLIDNPGEPISISNIVVVGSQMGIFLTDGTELGPFTLPTAQWQFRGEVTNTLPVNAMDVITVFGKGVYIVRVDHNIALPFDEFRVVSGQAAYRKVFGADDAKYSWGGMYPGTPGFGLAENAAIMKHIHKMDAYYAADAAVCTAQHDIVGDAPISYDVYKNTTKIGQIDFASEAVDGVFVPIGTAPFQFLAANKDKMWIKKPPGVLNMVAKELTVTFLGTRGVYVAP